LKLFFLVDAKVAKMFSACQFATDQTRITSHNFSTLHVKFFMWSCYRLDQCKMNIDDSHGFKAKLLYWCIA